MAVEFYGATVNAELEASRLLKLDYSGREQDWEIEFATPVLIEPILDLMESKSVDREVLNALALLLIACFQCCEKGQSVKGNMDRLSALMEEYPDVREKMFFYWIGLGRADNSDLLKRVLSTRPAEP